MMWGHCAGHILISHWNNHNHFIFNDILGKFQLVTKNATEILHLLPLTLILIVRCLDLKTSILLVVVCEFWQRLFPILGRENALLLHQKGKMEETLIEVTNWEPCSGAGGSTEKMAKSKIPIWFSYFGDIFDCYKLLISYHLSHFYKNSSWYVLWHLKTTIFHFTEWVCRVECHKAQCLVHYFLEFSVM